MLPDRVSNPGPLTYESGALPIALRGPAPGPLTYESGALPIALRGPAQVVHEILSFHISLFLVTADGSHFRWSIS